MKVFALVAACSGLLVAVVAATSAQTLSTAAPLAARTSPGGGTSRASFLVYEAQSNARSTQLDVVNQITALISKPHARLSAAERSDLYEALSLVALSGTGRPAISGTTIINNFPLVRMEACHEIGMLGGKRAETVLLKVLRLDNAPLVLAEAAYQLGRLKQNPGNRVSNAIVAALGHNSPRGEGIFPYEALAALRQLAKVSKGSPDPAVYSAIADIGTMGYSYRVDAAAAAALRAIVTYG